MPTDQTKTKMPFDENTLIIVILTTTTTTTATKVREFSSK